MDITYLIELDGRQYGPYTLESVRRFGLLPDTLVCRPSLSDEWFPASELPELRDFVDNTPGHSMEDAYFNAEYYYSENGSLYGALSILDLSVLNLTDQSLIGMNSMEDLKPVSEFPGLLALVQKLAAMDEEERRELETVIREQEADILRLEIENGVLKETAKQNSSSGVVPVSFDPEKEAASRYVSDVEGIQTELKNLENAIPKRITEYRMMFDTINAELEYRIKEYETSFDSALNRLSSLGQKSQAFRGRVESDLLDADRYLVYEKERMTGECSGELKAIEDDIRERIRGLDNSSLEQKESTISNLKEALVSKRQVIEDRINASLVQREQVVNQAKTEIRQYYNRTKTELVRQVEQVLGKFEEYFNTYFESKVFLAGIEQPIWKQELSLGSVPPTTVLLGKKEHLVPVFDKDISFEKRLFAKLLNNKHLCSCYRKDEASKCFKVINSLTARLLASSQCGAVRVTMIDAEDMNGTSDLFKQLNRNVFRIVSRQEDIRRTLDSMERRIEDIIQNLLRKPYDNLYEFNEGKEAKEPYELLIVKDFPSGFSLDSIELLKKILKNGTRAGVVVLLLVNQDMVDQSEDALKLYRLLGLEEKCSDGLVLMNSLQHQDDFGYSILDEEKIQTIVQLINTGFDSKKEEVLRLGDYLPGKNEWWTRKSGSRLEIPFGLSASKKVECLRITQESGQNSALVIGIPGSGKSVFLHTIIVNAAINYSPDELGLYLIDFSGVEFNSYANNKLPHAKIIAPEAEREFGLSVLRELVAEGQRRMELCREHDVSDIVDLRNVAPGLKVPRLLVIIDEFQKFFEIENDAISREANMHIHTIIQEFRKFGINLILATQKLPGAVLPKDLIANRIVFRCSPGDFSSLISLPSGERVPQLSTGECIYNSESGSPYDNTIVQTFYANKKERDELLKEISKHASATAYTKADTMRVFRSEDLPPIELRRKLPEHSSPSEFPAEVGIYFGESIAINEYDVCAPLVPESNNNILIIGKEVEVAESIAINSSLLAMDAHLPETASFCHLNFMRQTTNPLYGMPETYFGQAPFESVFASKQQDVNAALTRLKGIIEERAMNDTSMFHNCYLFIYDFQLGRMFDRGGRRGDDVSEEGQLLDFILKRGPQVNVFTVLQVDTLENLSRIASPLTIFEHKVVLQMEEGESTRVIGSGAASKLHVMNRPSSKFRAYYCDRALNILTKFKPYK